MKNSWIIELISSLLVLLFLYAGLSKLINYDVFVFQISESPFRLLARSANSIAWLIPVQELAVAAMLPFSRTRLPALYASVALMVIFTIYIGSMLISGLLLPCACGGIISGFTWKEHLLFNIFFLIISISGVFIEMKNRFIINREPSHSYSME